jgi:predicted chitinase
MHVACAYWHLADINYFAVAGNFRAETVRINGGLVNYPARLAWRNVWRRELGA